MCNEPIETQEHILETCPGLHTTNKTKVYKNEIFDEDINTDQQPQTNNGKNNPNHGTIKPKQ